MLRHDAHRRRPSFFVQQSGVELLRLSDRAMFEVLCHCGRCGPTWADLKPSASWRCLPVTTVCWVSRGQKKNVFSSPESTCVHWRDAHSGWCFVARLWFPGLHACFRRWLAGQLGLQASGGCVCQPRYTARRTITLRRLLRDFDKSRSQISRRYST